MSQLNKPMTHLTPNQRIAVARAVAIDNMPYFRSGIIDLVPREAPGLGTMALSKGSILLYDPDVLATWTPAQAGGVTLHEYMHQFLRHEERFQKLVAAGVLQDNPDDRAEWNLYCDAEINDDLIAAGIALPSFTDKDGQVHGPITPESRGWPPNRLAEEYLKIERQKPPPNSGGGGRKSSKQSPQGQQQGQQPAPGQPKQQGHGPGCGHCGSAAANPVAGEPAPNDPDMRSDVDEEVTRKSVCNAIQQASKSKGKVPLGLVRFVELDQKPAKVPWGQKLSRTLQTAVAFRPGAVDYTFRRPSRRQAAVSMLEYPPVLPGMHAPIAEVVLAVDTSGSMGDTEVQAILNEAEGIIRALSGSKITCIACDSQIHGIVKTRSVKEMKRSLKGGGGTDFRPVFRALEKLKPRPHVVVFGTDGYGDYPTHPPKGIHVVWLNIGGEISAGWGEVIDVDLEDT